MKTTDERVQAILAKAQAKQEQIHAERKRTYHFLRFGSLAVAAALAVVFLLPGLIQWISPVRTMEAPMQMTNKTSTQPKYDSDSNAFIASSYQHISTETLQKGKIRVEHYVSNENQEVRKYYSTENFQPEEIGLEMSENVIMDRAIRGDSSHVVIHQSAGDALIALWKDEKYHYIYVSQNLTAEELYQFIRKH